MLRFITRHVIGILVVAAIAGWALFYIPGTPSYAIFQLKQAVDARNGPAAATFIDFPSVVRNAGYEMVKRDAGGGDIITALVGKGAVDFLTKPMAAALQTWAERQVNDGAKAVQIPAGAVVGAIFLLHRSGDTAWTNFRDRKGRQWDIRMARNDGRWQIVEVKNVAQLLERLKRNEESRMAHPLGSGPAPYGGGATAPGTAPEAGGTASPP